MKGKLGRLAYKIIKALVWLFSPKMKVVGAENLPEEPVLVVANHCQMYGPIACELHFPGDRYTWCAGQMMHWDEVADYAFEDFWSHKPKRSLWFYKLLSHVITPLSVCVFNNAQTIPVYHDTRLLHTFRETRNKLAEGSSVVVFPEHDVPHNHIISDFQDKFIDIAKLYHNKTGKELCFVPMYIAPRLKTMVLGEPIRFDVTAPVKQERRRICEYLMAEITALACALPAHTVVPYRNIPKKDYPRSVPEEDVCEETCG